MYAHVGSSSSEPMRLFGILLQDILPWVLCLDAFVNGVELRIASQLYRAAEGA